MATSLPTPRTLSELDHIHIHIRISNLLKHPGLSFASELESVLDNADLVSSYQVPVSASGADSPPRTLRGGPFGTVRSLLPG